MANKNAYLPAKTANYTVTTSKGYYQLSQNKKKQFHKLTRTEIDGNTCWFTG